MNVPLDEVIFFDCITTHPSTGAATDADSTPTFAVYEESTDTDIGVGGNLTKRTSLTGNYRGTFTLSAANGFEAGKWYSVIASATVNSIAGKAVLKHFRVVAAESVAGYPLADVQKWLGGTIPAVNTTGIPKVDLVKINGTDVTSSTDPVDANLVKVNGTAVGCTLPTSGVVAAQADSRGVADNVNVSVSVPPVLKRPNSGSVAVRLTVQVRSYTGAMAAADSAPTVAVANQDGTSKDDRLQDAAASATTTMTSVATGEYEIYYLVTSADSSDNLRFAITTVKNSVTKVFYAMATVLESGDPTANASAWGSRVIGNSRTADMYLQGLTNKIEFSADGTTWTLYASDDATTLATGTAVRLGDSVNGLRTADPT